MRYLLFCTLIFLGINSIAQNNEKYDSVITNIYADTLKSIQTDLHQNSNKHFYLIKLKEGFGVIFEKQFKPQIKRQLNKNWFVIEADKNSIAKPA